MCGADPRGQNCPGMPDNCPARRSSSDDVGWLFERAGIVLAICVLDKGESGYLSWERLEWLSRFDKRGGALQTNKATH